MAEKNFSTPNNGVSVGARKERNMRDGLAIITQSVNRVTSFRTPRRTSKKGAEKTSPPRIMVCPSGLEPEPKASEAFMVSNSTTGTF